MTESEIGEALRLLRHMEIDGGQIGHEEVDLLARLADWIEAGR